MKESKKETLTIVFLVILLIGVLFLFKLSVNINSNVIKETTPEDIFVKDLTSSSFFSLIVLPDTQGYIENASLHRLFQSQINWITERKEEQNIIFVLHEGDIIQNPNSIAEWEKADEIISGLDGKVPYILSVGNHDMGNEIPADTRNTELYNTYFPYERYENEPWYGGHMGDDNDNYYTYFSTHGMDFMIISLEFAPTDDILDWANSIVAQNKDKRTIVLTHAYLYFNDTRTAPGQMIYPSKFGVNKTGFNDGEQMWQKFVKKHENIFLVLSGHIMGSGAGKLTSIGDNGNPVLQVLANHQFWPEGGEGWLRVMKFIPEGNKIGVITYSPYKHEANLHVNHSFLLEYEMTS